MVCTVCFPNWKPRAGDMACGSDGEGGSSEEESQSDAEGAGAQAQAEAQAPEGTTTS